MTRSSQQAWRAMPSSRFVSSRVWLGLPSSGGTGTLRDAPMSMGFIPQPWLLEPAARRPALATLADGAFAFADVSWPSTQGWRRLDRLCRAVANTASLQRITLSRLDGGQVSPQDRAWAKSPGFADRVSEWNDGNGATTPRDVLARAPAQVGVPPLAPEDLVPFSRALSPDEPVVPARALVRLPTGQSPEAFVSQLGSVLALVEELAGVGRHDLRLGMATLRARRHGVGLRGGCHHL